MASIPLRRSQLPFVKIEMFSGRTHSQKAELAKAITDAMVRIAQTTPEAVTIVFEDVQRDNWAEAGKLASDG